MAQNHGPAAFDLRNERPAHGGNAQEVKVVAGRAGNGK